MEVSVQRALELACSAQRLNGAYIKETEAIYSEDGRVMDYKFSNKLCILLTIDPNNRQEHDPKFIPPILHIVEDDIKLTEDIRNYYRRLMFTMLSQPENGFFQEIFSLLNKDTMNMNKMAFIACLPHVYEKDKKNNNINKVFKTCDNEMLGIVGAKIENLTAKIISCSRSKNFDAYNILAIIDNKIVSWFNKVPINELEVNIASAKIKGNFENYICKKIETRLNYVKVKK